MEKKKVIIITQARVGSTRLPGKVLKDVHGQPMLGLHLERLKGTKSADSIVVATTFEEGVDEILEIARRLNADIYQGSTNDVLDRFYQAAITKQTDYVVRVTSDCPLLDPELIDNVVDWCIEQDLDYASNGLKETFPDGQDIEVFKFSALEKAWNEARLISEREHVTPYIWNNSDFHSKQLFTARDYTCGGEYSDIRMTVDEPEDLNAIRTLVGALGTFAKWLDYASYVKEHAEEFRNQNVMRNEGYHE